MANINQDKRNAKGSGSVRQRKDGRWEARCTIDGKTRSFYADKQQDALKAMRAAQKENDDGLHTETTRITVGQWLKVWLEEYQKPIIRENTYYGTKGIINNYIIPALGAVKLRELTSPMIQRFYNDLNKNNSDWLVREVHAKFRTALNKAVKLRYLIVNPASVCNLPPKPQHEIKPLNEEEIKAFLENIKGHPLENLYIFTLFTGMRQGEVLGLSWDSVNFDEGSITVKQQLLCHRGKDYEKSRYYLGPTKSGKSRVITPAPFVMEILKRIRKEQHKAQITLESFYKNELNLVFTTPTGECLKHSKVYYHFKRIAEQLNIPQARFHDMRHTYAVTALQEGDNPKTVQETLGHATVEFTLNVYTHVTEKMKKDSAERMQNYYEKIKA